MNKMTLLTTAMVLSLSACASIVNGSEQDVRISPSGVNASGECKIQDVTGRMYYTPLPGSVLLARGDGPLNVTCTVENGSGQRKVEEELEPWLIGDVLLLSPLGLFIDFVNGAYQTYPDNISVPITLANEQPDMSLRTPVIEEERVQPEPAATAPQSGQRDSNDPFATQMAPKPYEAR